MCFPDAKVMALNSFRQGSLRLAANRTIINHGTQRRSSTYHDTTPIKGSLTRSERMNRRAYWQTIPQWADVQEQQFLDYQWQRANTVEKAKFFRFLERVVPSTIPSSTGPGQSLTAEDLRDDIIAGMQDAPMSIRLTPHILSIIDWTAPLQDPVFRQFVPLGSTLQQDHAKLSLDSLHESQDSPVPGLVHRYPDKVLFLTTAVCPVYCRFCTRSYAVGAPTASVAKQRLGLAPKSWERVFAYLEDNPQVHDVVISGGDTFYLQPEHLRLIGERLLNMPHIRRFRFASKGLAVCPSRFLDTTDDWATTMIDLSRRGRALGKEVALHTHFNHPNEITWVTRLAARRLFEAGLVVRNQSVLLRHVNDDYTTMSTLIRELANLNIRPLYVYLSDMVKGIEDMRTPLSTALYLESKIRGTIAGSMMPAFVVDLPEGGGKRLAVSFESYDKKSGISTFKAPGVKGEQLFHYYDPVETGNRHQMKPMS